MATYTQGSSNASYTPTGAANTNNGIYITGTAAPVTEGLTKATFYISLSSTAATGTFNCLHLASDFSIKKTSSTSYSYSGETGDKTLEFSFTGTAIAENDYILLRNCNSSQTWTQYIYDGGSSSPPFTNMIWSQQATGTCTSPAQDNKSSKNAKFIVETGSVPPPASDTVLLPPPYSEVRF